MPEETYVAVVLAADGVGTAGVSTNTDDADGAAGETNGDIDVLENDAQEAEESRASGGAGL